MKKRVFIVGLDGVGFDLINPWIEAEKLPNLGRLLAEGAHGGLLSTIPPITGPAWSSFQTGVNPGKHGVFGWTNRKPSEYGLSVINSHSLSYPTIWELASQNDRRVVSIGVPVTYPPRPVNGVIIPGILTPRNAPSPTYPPQAYSELRSVAPGYCFSPDCAQHLTIKAKVRALSSCAQGRAEVARHFMQKKDWDLFMLQFHSTDVVQHDLWGIKKAGLNPLLVVFQEVDRLLGELVEIAERDGASIIILSDHGMGPLEYTFSVNTWLLARGYLQLKRGAATRFKRLMFQLGFTQRRLYRLGRLLYPVAYRLGVANSFLDITADRGIAWLISSLFLSSDDIDWGRTRAYSRSDIGHVCLNLKGREPQGIVKNKEADSLVDELIKGLTGVVNPYTGEPLLGDVFRKQEVYHGDKLAQAPDILFLPKGLRTVGSGASGFYSNRPFDRPFTRAHHRMEGIVTAVGPPFRSRHNLQGAALIDLAPNILYLLDCPIPRCMDGKLWEEAFVPGTLEEQSPQWVDLSPGQFPEEPLTAADEEEIKQRLRNLGYLS